MLSSYNTDALCGACTRAGLPPADDTPRVPVRVWADPEVREALAAWNFGQVSRLVRQRGSIRQEDVAQLTGLSQGFLSMLESGARRLTSIDRIVDFLDGLSVPADLVRVPRRRPVPRTAPAPRAAGPVTAVSPAASTPAGPTGVPSVSPIGLAAGPVTFGTGTGSVRRPDLAELPWTAEAAVVALADATAGLTAPLPGSAARLPDLTGYVRRWAAAEDCAPARPQRPGAEIPGDLLRQLQATTDLLRRMDSEHGGGSLAQAGSAHLAVAVGLLRGGRYDEPTGRSLAAIAADAAGQAAWYQIEAGRPAGAPHRLLFAALRAAHASGDPRAGAGILLHLAVAAFRAGRPSATVDVVRAALDRTRTFDAPALQAMLLAWEARGHAKMGRRHESLRALGAAAELCGRAPGAGEPAWLPPLGEGDVHAQAGGCHLDLGDHRQAVQLLDRATETLRPEQVRTRGEVLARAAAARLRLGDVAGATRSAEQAVEIASHVRSACLDETIRPLLESLPALTRSRA
ncbi:helix-turn-helix domain-containing protein [Streptomyces sp. SL13]|uniref:Helix-turn-helix domain-containing protein n=1 Tax=Streptantibioticus silvisoli TaxID=2705255 RepID=A0AA90KHS9_9ACTN|nr:helix-turn-helix domain-containing protein [Streptantibioticus silvisoli]MDI5972240.1 helix-turn-helix domain-containing protein [Streptantibioticus silvisoli]